MDESSFKKTSRRVTVELIVIVVATIGARLPKPVSYGDAWTYVAQHPLLIAHIAVGVLVVVETVVLLVRSIRARQRLWIVLAAAGTVFLIVAFAAGNEFMASQQSDALNLMSYGWLAAIVTYGLSWYLGRRKRTVAART